MQIFSGRSIPITSNGAQASGVDTVFVGPGDATLAEAVLVGMDVQFANNQDHELGRLVVHLSTDLKGGLSNQIDVTAVFALRDWSGGDKDFNGDDPIAATIYYSLFVF